MNEILAVRTDRGEATAAAQDLAEQINAGLTGTPDAVVIFASSAFDYPALLKELKARCHPGLLVGASSAGEFTHAGSGTGTASALAIRSDDIVLSASIGTGISRDGREAARRIVSGFKGLEGRHPYRAALVMTDALAGHAESLVDELTLLTSVHYMIAGGGADDDTQF